MIPQNERYEPHTPSSSRLDQVVKSVISEHHRLKFNISRKIRNTYWILNISAEDENLEGEKEATEKKTIQHEIHVERSRYKNLLYKYIE